MASSSDNEKIPESRRLEPALKVASRSITWHYQSLPAETHQTIYHPAALQVFRVVFRGRKVPAGK